jgi:hypothetical protein
MPGPCSDVRVFKTYQLDLPEGNHNYMNKSHDDYELEGILIEAVHMHLYLLFKKYSKRAVPLYHRYR